MSRVLYVSHDYVRRSMAGPAIRSLELSRQLARAGHEVRLAVPISTDLDREAFEVVTYHPQQPETLRRLAAGCDVAVVQGWVLEHNAFLRQAGAAIAVDLYDPFQLEYLASVALDPTPGKFPPWEDVLGTIVEQVRVGDFFMCASERQRDMWIGALSVLNRVNSQTYEADHTLRSLIDVVPFGIPGEPPQWTAPAIRGVIPGIGPDDVVLLWGGGIYNWFDPLTLIESVGQVAQRLPGLRLVFMSASHPSPDVPRMEMLDRAQELAGRLGLTGRHVFFNEGWVPYDRRADWLLEADVGVSTHLDHAETRFSFRTRVLDYFWAGLPILCTAGDTLAEVVEREDLGFTVPPQDARATAEAIERLAADRPGRERRAARVRRVAASMTWERAAAPLLRFCAAPRRAPDLASLPLGSALPVPMRSDAERRRRAEPPPRPSVIRRAGRLAGRALAVTASEGPAGLVRAARRRLTRSEPGTTV